MATDNRSPSPASHYQIGGSLQLNAPTYVKRRADVELYEGLRADEFCYVLNCRQMGKSSLRVQVMAQLQAEGVACVAVQMTDIIDEEITPEQFYAGVIDSITMDLGLDDDFDNMVWWEANGELSLVKRFSKFLETVLLEKIPGKVVIFIDEIDRVLSMPFKVNGFFAAIRECYNKRSDQPAFRRLTFSLLGVATPSDLIEDKRSTPFNVGRAIALTGFTPTEAQPLALGLGDNNPTETLAAILKWTGGQPFLTQKVCRLVAGNLSQKDAFPSTTAWMDHLVQTNIIENWQSNDEPEHLRTIRDRLLQDEQRAARRLGLYQQILAHDGHPVARANTADLNRGHIELRLSGLVVEKQSQLEVYNPIYAAIFTPEWAAQKLADLRPYSGAIAAWLASDRTDKSLLLKGQLLNDAKHWADDKVLPPEDYAFLSASQELATAEAEEAQQVLARANKEATARMVTANRRLRIGSGILLGTIALAVIAGGSAIQINADAKEQRADAKEQFESTTKELKRAQQAREAAEADKQTAEQDKEDAQVDLEGAKAESEKIRLASEQQISDAQQQVEQAARQAQQAEEQTQSAQAATQQARQAESQAQQSAESAEQSANQAQLSAAAAQQAEAEAKEQQDIVKAGSELERQGVALLRRPSVQFRGLDTLLDALKVGKDLQDLANRTAKSSAIASIEDYPAISPMLALRVATNSILQTNQTEDILPFHKLGLSGEAPSTLAVPPFDWESLPGDYMAYHPELERTVKYRPDQNRSFLYDNSGDEVASLPGRFSGFRTQEQQLTTYSDSGGEITRLYDISGRELAAFPGRQPLFIPNSQVVVITSVRGNGAASDNRTT
ncbi:MAG: AAA-like domain-containing protein, partial [Cyanobacteria bacterium J06598_3]